MRIILAIIGVVLLLNGLLFLGQGAGIIDWPATSLMIDQRPWVIRGALIALAGAVLLWLSRRR
jgi:hypothetical protein